MYIIKVLMSHHKETSLSKRQWNGIYEIRGDNPRFKPATTRLWQLNAGALLNLVWKKSGSSLNSHIYWWSFGTLFWNKIFRGTWCIEHNNNISGQMFYTNICVSKLKTWKHEFQRDPSYKLQYPPAIVYSAFVKFEIL